MDANGKSMVCGSLNYRELWMLMVNGTIDNGYECL